MKVSVIVPTYNSQDTLFDCLSSIKNQTYDDIELIVVDNNSTDRTPEIAAEFADTVIQEKSSMTEARNIGIQESTGEILLSIDSDMILRSNVVEKVIQQIRQGSDAVIIPEISCGTGFWTGVKWFKKWLHLGDLLFESPRGFRREVAEYVGGYDESLLDGEDYDLHIRVRKAGFKIDYISTHLFHNEGALTLGSWLREKYRYGKTTDSFIEKHKEWYRKKGKRHLLHFYLENIQEFMKYPHFGAGLLLVKVLTLLPWKLKISPRALPILGERSR